MAAQAPLEGPKRAVQPLARTILAKVSLPVSSAAHRRVEAGLVGHLACPREERLVGEQRVHAPHQRQHREQAATDALHLREVAVGPGPDQLGLAGRQNALATR